MISPWTRWIMTQAVARPLVSSDTGAISTTLVWHVQLVAAAGFAVLSDACFAVWAMAVNCKLALAANTTEKDMSVLNTVMTKPLAVESTCRGESQFRQL